MEVNSERKEKYSIVSVSGKIDAITCSDLEDTLIHLLDAGENRIILNMRGCDYISSAGLRVLLVSAKQLYGSGLFALCSLDDNVSEILEMAGFSTFMNIYANLETAEAEMA